MPSVVVITYLPPHVSPEALWVSKAVLESQSELPARWIVYHTSCETPLALEYESPFEIEIIQGRELPQHEDYVELYQRAQEYLGENDFCTILHPLDLWSSFRIQEMLQKFSEHDDFEVGHIHQSYFVEATGDGEHPPRVFQQEASPHIHKTFHTMVLRPNLDLHAHGFNLIPKIQLDEMNVLHLGMINHLVPHLLSPFNPTAFVHDPQVLALAKEIHGIHLDARRKMPSLSQLGKLLETF